MNATMEKFGYPATLVRDFEYWVVLLRPAQVTLGSLILAAKSDATAFGDLPPAAHAELAPVTAYVEQLLSEAVAYDRINYLMLMMVDPYVHFHIFPRYEAPPDVRIRHGRGHGLAGPARPQIRQRSPRSGFRAIEASTRWKLDYILLKAVDRLDY